MTTLTAIFLPMQAAVRVVRAAFDEVGYDEVADFVELVRPSKHKGLMLSLSAWEHGQVLKAELDEALLAALGRRVVAEKGTLVAIESAIEASWVTEWDVDGPRRQEIRNPDWAEKERRREEPAARIAAWQLEEVAERRLGARKRERETMLYFRLRPVAPVDVVRRAIAAGTAVTEVQHAGRTGFRVALEGGARIVFLSADETAEIRARLAP